MKKKKLLSALLLCCAISLPVCADTGINNPKGQTETVSQNMSGYSGTYGGAVYNEGTLNIDSGIEFTDNFINADSGGGAAIYNNGGSIVAGETVKFINNGINNKEFGEIIVNGSAGGAIASWNGGTVNIGTGSEFSGNGKNSQGQATWGFGGAIYIDNNEAMNGNLTIGDGALFTNNIATGAGAIYTGVDTTIGKSEFTGNRAEGHLGGAIYAFGGYDDQIEVNIDTSTFDKNYSGTDGGAIANIYSVNTTVADGSEFTNNEAARNGGAIANRGYINSDGELVAEITANGNFENNKAGANGGAVYNAVDYATSKEDKQAYGKAHISGTFTNNSAGQNGGAVYNDAYMEISNAEFSNNKAANGGAVYNTADGSIAMETVTFNAAAGSAKNDIYNAGAITTSGTNTFASNISGTGSIENSGTNNFSGDNSAYSGSYSHASENAVTTVTGTFFGGDSYEFDKGTLNWDTQKDYAGKLTVSGNSNLNIGETQTGVLNLREGSSIAGSVATAIKEGSTLNIIGGEATLDSGDTWSGKVVLGTAGIENDTSSLTVGLPSGSTVGKLEAKNGALNILGGLNLDIEDGSYIKDAVAITTSGNINIKNGGEVAIDDNDTLNGGAKVTLTDGGTLNYYKNGGSTIIEADGGDLYLREGAELALNAGTSITNEVNLHIMENSTLALEDNLNLNLTSTDEWVGRIENNNGGTINANGFYSAGANLEQKGESALFNIDNGSAITLKNNSLIEKGGINITNDSVLTADNANITGGDMTIDEDSSFVVKSGTFKLDTLTSSNLVDGMNNEINKSYIGTLTADGQADFNIDIHARSNHNRSNDQFVVTNPVAGDGVVNINDWSLQGDIYGWDAPIDRRIVLDHIFVDENGNPLEGVIEATDKETFTPIGWYELKRNAVSGVNYSLDLVKFNPQVFRGQVATVAQWMNQLAIDDMLFTHSMVLPSFKEENGKMANNYAAINPLFAPYQYSIKDGGLWYKMYGTFEHLQMNNNLRVGNNSYGALIGADFGMKDLKNGWKFMPTAYIGYNGAHQYWSGMGQYQNGGQAGLMGTWYKDNFIVGGLVYGGVYDNSMDVHGTTDNTFNYFAGASTKASYNIRLHRDWVLQPNLMAAYNYFGQQNWHSDFGQMGMMAGMLHGVNIAPGVNLIWEKETFSAYATLQYMYNINGACGGRAGNVGLPQVEMERGYIQYGLGFTKKFTDRASGYLQAVLRNVGRTGVGFQAGFNIKLGK